jgi:hypothetical protein
MNNQILLLPILLIVGFVVAQLSFKYNWKLKEWF